MPDSFLHHSQHTPLELAVAVSEFLGTLCTIGAIGVINKSASAITGIWATDRPIITRAEIVT